MEACIHNITCKYNRFLYETKQRSCYPVEDLQIPDPLISLLVVGLCPEALRWKCNAGKGFTTISLPTGAIAATCSPNHQDVTGKDVARDNTPHLPVQITLPC